MVTVESTLINMQETMDRVNMVLLYTNPFIVVVFLFFIFLGVIVALTFSSKFSKKFLHLDIKGNKRDYRAVTVLRILTTVGLALSVGLWINVQQDKKELEGEITDLRMYSVEYSDKVEENVNKYLDKYREVNEGKNTKEVIYKEVTDNWLTYTEDGVKKDVRLDLNYSDVEVIEKELYLLKETEEGNHLIKVKKGTKLLISQYKIETESVELAYLNGLYEVKGILE